MNINNNQKNVIGLFLIQFGAAFFPLVLMPYCYSVLGAEVFSLLAISESFVLIVLTIGLYGFDIYGVSGVLDRIKSNAAIFRLFFAILFARLSIFFVSSVIFGVFIFLFKRSCFEAFLLLLGYPFGVIIQSNYYYLASQKNLILGVFVGVPKVILVAWVLFFDEGHTLQSMAIVYSSGYIASGIFSVVHFYRLNRSPVSSRILRLSAMITKRTISNFVASLAVFPLRGLGLIIVSSLTDNSEHISAFALADRFVKLAQASIYPLTQWSSVALIVGVKATGLVWSEVRKLVFRRIRWIVLVSLLYIFLYLVAYLFVDMHSLISIDVPGGFFTVAALMSPAILFGSLSSVVNGSLYESIGANILYMKLLVANSFFSVVLLFLLTSYFSVWGSAISLAIVESMLFLSLYLFLRREIECRQS